MTTTIDMNELIAALQDACAQNAADEPNVFTSLEFAERRGCSRIAAVEQIRIAVKQGLVEPAKKKTPRICGGFSTVAAYRILTPKEPKRKGKR